MYSILLLSASPALSRYRFRIIRIILTLCLIHVFPTFAGSSADSDWKLRKDKDGIMVFSRHVSGSKYEEFRGTVEIDASLAAGLALLDDTKVCPEWLYRCQSSKVLARRAGMERIIYQVTDLPFPAATRDAIFHARVHQLPSGDIRVDLDSEPDYIEDTSFIRIRKARGHYLLEKISAERSRLTWTQFVDPAGQLPAFMVNSLLTDIPWRSLRRFRQLVTRSDYQKARFVYDASGTPVGLIY